MQGAILIKIMQLLQQLTLSFLSALENHSYRQGRYLPALIARSMFYQRSLFTSHLGKDLLVISWPCFVNTGHYLPLTFPIIDLFIFPQVIIYLYRS